MSDTPIQKVEPSLNYRLPSDVTLKHAAKIGIVEDKPILLDYWTASLDKKALVGAKDQFARISGRPIVRLTRSPLQHGSTRVEQDPFEVSAGDWPILVNTQSEGVTH